MTALGLALLLLLATPAEREEGWGRVTQSRPSSYVDPFIGTGAHGHTYPGATLPFGMVQLSPDTRLEGWDGCSGYHYTDDDGLRLLAYAPQRYRCMSDYGDVLFMPVVELAARWSTAIPHRSRPAATAPASTRRPSSRLPGYYAVHARPTTAIDVELTATERTGLHRYRLTPEETAPTQLILDLAHRDRGASNRVAARRRAEREIEGHPTLDRLGARPSNVLLRRSLLCARSRPARIEAGDVTDRSLSAHRRPGRGRTIRRSLRLSASRPASCWCASASARSTSRRAPQEPGCRAGRT